MRSEQYFFEAGFCQLQGDGRVISAPACPETVDDDDGRKGPFALGDEQHTFPPLAGPGGIHNPSPKDPQFIHIWPLCLPKEEAVKTVGRSQALMDFD
jgi:hypothetical protein